MKLGIKTTLAALAMAAASLVAGSAGAVTATLCGNKYIGLTQAGMDLSPAICAGVNSTGSGSPIEAAGWTDLYEVSKTAGISSHSSAVLTINQAQNSWALTNAGGYSSLGISVKQGNGFAFYVLDLAKALNGNWYTGNNSSLTSNDYSHINAWGIRGDDGPTPPEVPLPAGGVLLLSALGGGALLKRRKKA